MTPPAIVVLLFTSLALQESCSILTGIPDHVRIRSFKTLTMSHPHRPISTLHMVPHDVSSSAAAAATEHKQDSPPFHPLCILGICGPIGSGKSYACSLLVSHCNCAHHIDTDSLAHSLYDTTTYPNNRQLIEEIKKVFGPQVIHESDGTVNRKALGSIVFGDSSAMTRLEQIVWPHLKQRLIDRLSEIQKKYQTPEDPSSTSLPDISNVKNESWTPRPIVVVEAAVLIDTQWDDDGLFDAIWAIDASMDTSTQRLIHKRGMKQADALQRLAVQRRRRGIGNLLDELAKGVVTAKIINDVDCQEDLHNNTNNSHCALGSNLTETENILLERLKRALMDPACWKPGRYPLI